MVELRNYLQRLRGNLYVVPLLIVAASIALARLTILVDHAEQSRTTVSWLLSTSVAGGRAITGAVAAATITVAAIVFSMMALSSQIAATQYSPRAVAGFVDDRLQKIVTGLVVGTFVFSLLVLADLSGVAPANEVARPSLSVTAVLVLGIVSAVAIVAYLDHSLRRMRIDAVVRRIAEFAAEAVREQDRNRTPEDDLGERSHTDSQPLRVQSTKSGWVLAIDAAHLIRQLPADTLVRIEVRLGEAIFAGDLLATVWTEDQSRSAARAIERAIRLGRARTSSQDASYGIRQLVDIGLRALSPGINDPTTAIDVVQHLKLPLREILTLDPPQRVYTGPERRRVFLPEAPTRSDHVHDAFSELRLAAAQQPAVLKVMINVLGELVDEMVAEDREGRTAELRKQAELAFELAEQAGFPESDLKPILDAARRIGLEPAVEPGAD